MSDEKIEVRPGYIKMTLPSMYGPATAQLFHHEDDQQGFQSFILQVKGPWKRGWDKLHNIGEDLEEIRSVIEYAEEVRDAKKSDG